MADVIYVGILVAFFAVSALFVRACEWIVGTGAQPVAMEGGGEAPEPEAHEVAA